MTQTQNKLSGLSSAKRAVLFDLLRKKSSPIRPVPRDRELPLSFAQQRLWFLDRLAPDNPFYNMFGAVRLTGALDLDALRGAFREIVRRHEALRTSFQPGERGPAQVIAPPRMTFRRGRVSPFDIMGFWAR
jgi:hypothetical protein